MVFTTFIAADMYGKKCNIEIGFNGLPCTVELEKEIERVLKMEALVNRPEGVEMQKVEVGKIQALDDTTGAWKDLLPNTPLADYCQLYVIQPNITDVVGPIPYPSAATPHVAPVASLPPPPAPHQLPLPLPDHPAFSIKPFTLDPVRPLSSGPSLLREEHLKDKSRTLLPLDAHRCTVRQETVRCTEIEPTRPYRLMPPCPAPLATCPVPLAIDCPVIIAPAEPVPVVIAAEPFPPLISALPAARPHLRPIPPPSTPAALLTPIKVTPAPLPDF
eukprot:TRINITY_DN11766_c0_g1_i3.p1 TRINITY_DN11766_c0_g1~~TRINITY_DN11766_c0_g1_i3.p1  ORF type:complete len:274 (+),score=40.92 TRINITY_DN11766_c0_g1_i3:68-889(+)